MCNKLENIVINRKFPVKYQLLSEHLIHFIFVKALKDLL